MPTPLQNLETRRDAISAEIAALDGRPNFTADGINVDWLAYRKQLYDELTTITQLIAQYEGPCVEVTYGI